MFKVSRVFPVALFAIGLLIHLGRPDPVRAELRMPLSVLPVEMSGYLGTDMQIDSAELAQSGVDSYLMRTYARDGGDAEFSVYVGYYEAQNQDNRVHSPRNCLPGAGWEVLTNEPRDSGHGTVSRYLIEGNGVRAVVYFWYQGRQRISATETTANLRLLRDGVMTGRSEEALIRVLIPVSSEQSGSYMSQESADELGMSLVREIIPSLTESLP